MRVKAWMEGVQVMFPNLKDDCCPMGRGLRPIENLNKAMAVLEGMQKALLEIADKQGRMVEKGYDQPSLERQRGERDAYDHCASIAESALDRKYF